MTREELFEKYACSCKDPNCAGAIKAQCLAKFLRDLDLVFDEMIKNKQLISKAAAIRKIGVDIHGEEDE